MPVGRHLIVPFDPDDSDVATQCGQAGHDPSHGNGAYINRESFPGLLRNIRHPPPLHLVRAGGSAIAAALVADLPLPKDQLVLTSTRRGRASSRRGIVSFSTPS